MIEEALALIIAQMPEVKALKDREGQKAINKQNEDWYLDSIRRVREAKLREEQQMYLSKLETDIYLTAKGK